MQIPHRLSEILNETGVVCAADIVRVVVGLIFELLQGHNLLQGLIRLWRPLAQQVIDHPGQQLQAAVNNSHGGKINTVDFKLLVLTLWDPKIVSPLAHPRL
jgi:hypothetical protein